jgi:hypothetical protein
MERNPNPSESRDRHKAMAQALGDESRRKDRQQARAKNQAGRLLRAGRGLRPKSGLKQTNSHQASHSMQPVDQDVGQTEAGANQRQQAHFEDARAACADEKQ